MMQRTPLIRRKNRHAFPSGVDAALTIPNAIRSTRVSIEKRSSSTGADASSVTESPHALSPPASRDMTRSAPPAPIDEMISILIELLVVMRPVTLPTSDSRLDRRPPLSGGVDLFVHVWEHFGSSGLALALGFNLVSARAANLREGPRRSPQ